MSLSSNPRRNICEAARLLKAKGLSTELQGCSYAEIADFQKQAGVLLPTSYRTFLRLMGKKCGGVLTGSDFLYPKPLDFRAAVEALLAEGHGTFKLPPSAFVFLSHQGYQFLYFDEGDPDPLVFRLGDDVELPEATSYRFSDWFLGVVGDELALD